MKTEVIDNFPAWALCYVVNGDRDCLEDDEVKMVDDYISALRDYFDAKWVDIVPEDESSYFSSFPEFGKACDCVTVTVLYQHKDDCNED